MWIIKDNDCSELKTNIAKYAFSFIQDVAYVHKGLLGAKAAELGYKAMAEPNKVFHIAKDLDYDSSYGSRGTVVWTED